MKIVRILYRAAGGSFGSLHASEGQCMHSWQTTTHRPAQRSVCLRAQMQHNMTQHNITQHSTTPSAWHNRSKHSGALKRLLGLKCGLQQACMAFSQPQPPCHITDATQFVRCSRCFLYTQSQSPHKGRPSSTNPTHAMCDLLTVWTTAPSHQVSCRL